MPCSVRLLPDQQPSFTTRIRASFRSSIPVVRGTLMAKLNINGRVHNVQVEPGTPLLWVIREQVGLTGTKYGCGVAQRGACSVHINGEVILSYAIALGDLKAGDKIVTIEGLSPTSTHPGQKAWAAIDVPQCGYCQS